MQNSSEAFTLKVADYIAQYLAQKEVSHVFGMSGANIEDLYSAIHRNNSISIILAKNEYNASTMAIGSYLATQKVAVVLTTSGPGVLNTLPVLAEAFSSRIPFILISGMVPTHLEGQGAFQDTSGLGGTFDICQMLKPCTGQQIKIKEANEIPIALEKAFSSTLKNKKPAVILIPKDIFNKEISELVTTKEINFTHNTCPLELINAINFCRQFSRAEHVPPLIILGEELVHLSSMNHIRQFIEKSGAAVAVTAISKGLFDHKSSQFLGLIGVMGHNEVNEYLKHTDHVILAGTNFELLHRHGIESAIAQKHLLVIKEEKSSALFALGGKTLCEIYGNIEDNFAKITESITAKDIPISFKRPKPDPELLGYNLKNIISEIQTAIEDDANIFVDAGNTGAFTIHHLETSGKGTCYVSLGMGGMGNSIGAGIGSSVASGKKSYIFLGDGSFLMHGLEIHTALEYNLPVVFFIFNNNSHGMCTTRENVFLGGETGINNFRSSHYAEGIAKIFPGVIAHEVQNLAHLKLSLDDIKQQNSPCVISINIPNTEDPPFKTFNKIQEAPR